ncbi:HR1 rho-binding repeat [Trinorchestia longiramus]|nr:HR1 rho-binding repeat [Trinorchestia longiramus]
MLWESAGTGVAPATAWYPNSTKNASQVRQHFSVPDCLVCSIAPTASTLLFLYSINPVVPVVHELSHRYGLSGNGAVEVLGGDASNAISLRLGELREHIRRQIRKELKIKEGAENLRKATNDRRTQSDVAHMVKEANGKLSRLQQDLAEVDSQILLTQGQGGALPSVEDFTAVDPPMSPQVMSASDGGPDHTESPSLEPTPYTSMYDSQLRTLEKQLIIETKVKQGAENMIQMYSSGRLRDKKLAASAQQMLADSRAKIEYIKMRINKLKQVENGMNNESTKGNQNSTYNLTLSVDVRVEQLLHRLHVERRVMEGARNAVRTLENKKMAVDKKYQQEYCGRIALMLSSAQHSTPPLAMDLINNSATRSLSPLQFYAASSLSHAAYTVELLSSTRPSF